MNAVSVRSKREAGSYEPLFELESFKVLVEKRADGDFVRGIQNDRGRPARLERQIGQSKTSKAVHVRPREFESAEPGQIERAESRTLRPAERRTSDGVRFLDGVRARRHLFENAAHSKERDVVADEPG